VREALGLGYAAVADLVSAVEHLTGVDVGTMPLTEKVPGICVTDPDWATSIILVNSNDVAERQRFTLAHELAHVLFGDATHADAVDGERTSREVLCDEFASNLLIPRAGVRAWLARTGTVVSREGIDERKMAMLARHLGASPDRPVAQLEQALTEAGVFVKPVVRRADVAALVARAEARRSIEGPAVP
jgi:hypothetical protein